MNRLRLCIFFLFPCKHHFCSNLQLFFGQYESILSKTRFVCYKIYAFLAHKRVSDGFTGHAIALQIPALSQEYVVQVYWHTGVIQITFTNKKDSLKMEHTLGQVAQIAALIVAIFYLLLALSGLFNLYLRYNDNLTIDREDVQALARSSGNALLLAGVAGLFNYLSFFSGISVLLCGLVFFQILKIKGLLKILERQ